MSFVVNTFYCITDRLGIITAMYIPIFDLQKMWYKGGQEQCNGCLIDLWLNHVTLTVMSHWAVSPTIVTCILVTVCTQLNKYANTDDLYIRTIKMVKNNAMSSLIWVEDCCLICFPSIRCIISCKYDEFPQLTQLQLTT